MKYEWNNENFLISTDRSKLDFNSIHKFLSEESYWAKQIPESTLKTAIEHSENVGVYDINSKEQVGFARVVTDYSTFAYLCDVYIKTSYRARGLGTLLVDFIVKHPKLQNLRRFLLATRDAHSLYSKFGFSAIESPENLMQKHDRNVYLKNNK